MKELVADVTHEDEPQVEYSPGYQVLTFPFYHFVIVMKVATEWNMAPKPEVYIKIYNEDERDVTADYMYMDGSPGFIRPTLYNLKEVMAILEENMEADDEEEEDDNITDTAGI
jgi:hypothetical protein